MPESPEHKIHLMDAYIAKCSEIAQPIVFYLCSLIRETIPQIEEKIKWGSPSFELKGKIVCQIMAHTKHVNFIFTNGKEWNDPYGLLTNIGEKSNMKGFKQISRVEDLPEKKMLQDYIIRAAEHVSEKRAGAPSDDC